MKWFEKAAVTHVEKKGMRQKIMKVMFQHAALTLFPPQCGPRWSAEARTSSKEV